MIAFYGVFGNELLFTIIISIFIINNANALKIDEKYQTMCNNI